MEREKSFLLLKIGRASISESNTFLKYNQNEKKVNLNFVTIPFTKFRISFLNNVLDPIMVSRKFVVFKFNDNSLVSG